MYQFPLATSQTAHSGNPTEILRSKKIELQNPFSTFLDGKGAEN